eukprot:bmy_16801T0
MSLGVIFLLGLVFCWDQRIRAQTGATEDETKSQVNDDSSSPDMDFQEENQHDVSVDIPPEEDRQMDMHVHTEEDPPESSESSSELHQDPLTGSGDSLPSCTTEDSSK